MTRSLRTVDIGLAADRLAGGGLVAVPTETVYGLAVRADDPTAVRRMYDLKGRPYDHPSIVHVPSTEAVHGWAHLDDGPARILADACWPGPLTLLLPRGPRVVDEVTGGRSTVGVRVPAQPATLAVLERLGTGVAAPSANRFGRVSPTTADHVLDDLGHLLDPERDAVLDGGPCRIGVESTIVDCTVEPPQILRPGGIAVEDVHRLLGGDVARASGPSRAAGMLAAHYAPTCRIVLTDDLGSARERLDAERAEGRRADVLDRTDDLVLAARSLYDDLRGADRRALDVLVVVLPPATGLGHALRDRLVKAAVRPDGPSRAG